MAASIHRLHAEEWIRILDKAFFRKSLIVRFHSPIRQGVETRHFHGTIHLGSQEVARISFSVIKAAVSMCIFTTLGDTPEKSYALEYRLFGGERPKMRKWAASAASRVLRDALRGLEPMVAEVMNL